MKKFFFCSLVMVVMVIFPSTKTFERKITTKTNNFAFVLAKPEPMLLPVLPVFVLLQKKIALLPKKKQNYFYGSASWYGPGFFGKKKANGKIYEQEEIFVAHKKIPFGTTLIVTNLINKKTIRVKVEDRGPFVKERVLDLSFCAARLLDAVDAGVIPIKVKILKGGLEI